MHPHETTESHFDNGSPHATCKCGKKTRVELQGQSGKRVLKVGCEDHWVELPAEGLKAALAKAEGR